MDELGDPYWINAARLLARVLAQMPGLKLPDSAEEAQRLLASYAPPKDAWDEWTENERTMFVMLRPKEFQGILDVSARRVRGSAA